MSSARVLGVRVDRINLIGAVELVSEWVKQDKKRYIVTVNPEFVMQAQKDGEFRKILNQADLAICDGIGLRLASRDARVKLIRVTGRELMQALIKKGYKTMLVGSQSGIARKAAETIRLNLVGNPTRFNLEGISEPDVRAINKFKPDLLFVGMGMVKQEKWIVKNLAKLKVKVAMGVGGAIDQLNDPSLVAPVWMQTCGLEWLYRLIRQPWRIKRQLNLVKFAWLTSKQYLL
jgi:N-acetylglucosaminyldiphosphoundecaprenol N-acetyl-beta-D-mannosaminyltransferase